MSYADNAAVYNIVDEVYRQTGLVFDLDSWDNVSAWF